MTHSATGLDQGASRFPFLLTHRRRTQGFREWLTPREAETSESSSSSAQATSQSVAGRADATSLTMLWIPPGRFWMGSPNDEPEQSEDEAPQHPVQLEGFFMAQTPVTQAQWRAVACWQPTDDENHWPSVLDPDPVATLKDSERFLGDHRPVVNVSWHDAMAFCRRLCQRTGRHYTLPSEAQWEYACRAGTTTPFHFGETITTELANYDGTHTYGNGAKGENRWQTTDVTSFPANAWGLHDMHGNVLEWCTDHWHATYQGAPEDGRPWQEDEKTHKDFARLLRGGAWRIGPSYCRSACRSAYRDNSHTHTRGDHIGFRVCHLH